MAGLGVRAGVLDQLSAVFRFGVVGELSDSHLLHRFLTGRDGADQAAFSALVERHRPMVLSVCNAHRGDTQSVRPVRDVATGSRRTLLRARGSYSAALTPDVRSLAAADDDAIVRVWKLAQVECGM
jgi:hypothetical protein